ncbi:hypothetical protein [Phaeobacter gallaeciensis]|uniref:Nuclear transport factor 2 family protein n=1 Tax=Phaeobacter gallaeciensis TaxID=60890 RepID=A0AAC9Z7R5_9RHOB|nr:hypothetical protein [Phaeobacter gallaeciensis]AHD08860.1 hypothetical protein Gal_01087 [Phaeobacter gallaeciensis DSM 26640]ATE92126.1 hypothetical protein PhaeoP11_01082 [Phaeobacter gallaeciensis]ATE98055.1 hypothetical protein PhaeoP73_02767 [Phaeobacter gallaeciensis]ATF00737.1 hypothetical protein PhaeoP75_01078 [Phaeobacter gallaeciensis]ATF05168.1 hypothetical protein PhaeoP63_01077 [Phaeobacter gallaeciensis]
MSVTAIRQTMDSLIQAGTSFDLDALDHLYHDDMQILMINQDGVLNKADKSGFIAMFKGMKETSSGRMNTWAQFNDITSDGTKGHVLITRKNDLAGTPSLMVLSIDLIFDDNRWQIAREVIFIRPDTGDYPGQEN